MFARLEKQRQGYSRVWALFRSMSSLRQEKPVESTMRDKLQTGLNPSHMEILNESYMHNVPKGSETHFKVVVVSDKFDGQPLIKRHRIINDLLQNELQTSVHALSIVAETPAQWEKRTKTIEPSPTCRGGFGK